MKKILTTALILFAACGGMISPTAAATICLSARDIRNTDAPDGKTIVFQMANGDVWRNTLKGSCPDLKFNGFVWRLQGIDQVCENQQSIRVLQSGQICLLGKFDKMASAAKK